VIKRRKNAVESAIQFCLILLRKQPNKLRPSFKPLKIIPAFLTYA